MVVMDKAPSPFPEPLCLRPHLDYRAPKTVVNASKEALLHLPKAPQGTAGPHGRSRARSSSSWSQPNDQQARTAKPPQAHSWVNVAKAAAKGYDLTYVPLTFVDNKVVITLSEEVLEATDPKWLECLVGYYLGGNNLQAHGDSIETRLGAEAI